MAPVSPDFTTRHKNGISKLDVPDLRLDLRRRSRFAGRRHCAGHALGGRSHQLDLPGMRRAQGRLRDGPDLKPVGGRRRAAGCGIAPERRRTGSVAGVSWNSRRVAAIGRSAPVVQHSSVCSRHSRIGCCVSGVAHFSLRVCHRSVAGSRVRRSVCARRATAARRVSVAHS